MEQRSATLVGYFRTIFVLLVTLIVGSSVMFRAARAAETNACADRER